MDTNTDAAPRTRTGYYRIPGTMAEAVLREVLDADTPAPRPALQSIYFVEYVDGTFGECRAAHYDDALDVLDVGVEMAHGPVEGRAPADADVDRHFSGLE